MFNKKEKENLIYLEFTELKQYGFRVIFTTRIGGFSQKPYDSLNLGLHTDDKKENVLKNRKKLYRILNFNPHNLIYAEQTHSNNIKLVNLDDKGKGVMDQLTAVNDKDGLISTDQNMVLGGHFADCVPIYIMDKSKGFFSLVHSGWKGTYQQILSKTINFFIDNLDSSIKDILVVMGPAISGQNYEVSFDLIEKFKNNFDLPLTYINESEDSYFLDLKELNKLIALQNGIIENNIYISKLCTFNEEKLFYSYRRDQRKTGRMAAFISRF